MADYLGRAPSVNEFMEEEDIIVSVIYRVFDSWDDALREAGLEKDKEDNIYSDERVLEEIKATSERIDGILTAKKFQKESDISYNTVYRRFGSWSKAVSKAL